LRIVRLALRSKRMHRPDLSFLSPCFGHSAVDSYLNRTKPPAPGMTLEQVRVPMDSTLSSAKIDPHHDIVPSAEDRFTGVEDALSRLANRAARDIPDPQAPAESSNVSGPPVAEATVPATTSTVPAGPQVVPSVPATASAVSADPQVVAEPSVSATASTVPVAPQVVEPSVPPTAATIAPVPRVAEPTVRATAADVSAGPQVGGPFVLATVRPAEFRQVPLPSEKPSLRSRATRAVTRFLIAVCVGVAGSLAWQSYGGAAREMIANRIPQLAIPQLAWISSRPVTTETAAPAATTQTATSSAIEASAPQPAAAQAAPVAQTATEQTAATPAAATVPAAPSPNQQQLDAMARDIGALRQSVDQLVARQEQMARDMARLQAAETPRHRVSAPPPRVAAVPAHKPPMPPQAAPPVLASAVTPAQPRPQMSSDLPPPAVPPPPAALPQPAAAPQMLRPPAPVPEH
jgi:hypothetical protein